MFKLFTQYVNCSENACNYRVIFFAPQVKRRLAAKRWSSCGRDRMGQRRKIKRENFRLVKAYSFGLRLGTFLNHVHRPQGNLTWLWSKVGLPLSLSFFIFVFLLICVNLQYIKLYCWIGPLFANRARSINIVMKITAAEFVILWFVLFAFLTFWHFWQVNKLKVVL